VIPGPAVPPGRRRPTWVFAIALIAGVAAGLLAAQYGPSVPGAATTRSPGTVAGASAEPTTAGPVPSAAVPTRPPPTAAPRTLSPPIHPPGQDQGGGAQLHLMDATELAPLDPRWSWQTVGTTAGEGSTPGGMCQAATLESLGAHDVARRDYTGPDPQRANAGQVVGSFDDEGEAANAYASMRGWRTNCPGRMRAENGWTTAEVGPLRQVATHATEAGWWLGTFGPVSPGRDSWYAATGIARDGAVVSVLWIEVRSTRAPQSDPMAATLRQSALLMRSSTR